VNFRRSQGESARAERWKLEDAAPRLKAEVPDLASLRLSLSESKRGTSTREAVRISHIVVDRAAALFLVACSDTRCRDGGHDITHEIMSGLRRHTEVITGSSICHGSVGTAEAGGCGRQLWFQATATYDNHDS
jgi:hypothetical protein